ncbi:Kinesin-like protein kif27 [Allomyces arbusculus]|nr:Kinesin-like protein kif27 [Allomyces arbusculus]
MPNSPHAHPVAARSSAAAAHHASTSAPLHAPRRFSSSAADSVSPSPHVVPTTRRATLTAAPMTAAAVAAAAAAANAVAAADSTAAVSSATSTATRPQPPAISVTSLADQGTTTAHHVVFDPNVTPVRAWDALITAIHVFNLILIPLAIGWTCYFATPGWALLGYTMDACLLANVGITATRPFLDEFGNLVTHVPTIRTNYFYKARGFYELLGALPFDLIAWYFCNLDGACVLDPNATYLSHRTQNLPDMLFLWAILRTTRFFSMINTTLWFFSAEVPGIDLGMARLLKSTLVFLFLAHLDGGCFWAFCYHENDPGSWINATGIGLDANNPGHLVSFWDQFMTNFGNVYQVMFFQFRDTASAPEQIYVLIELLFGIVINGIIIGDISDLITAPGSDQDAKHKKHKFRMQHLAQYLQDKLFPPELQRRGAVATPPPHSHAEFEFLRQHGMDEEELFGKLPKSLRVDISEFLYLDIVAQLPVLGACDRAFQSAVARVMRTVLIHADSYIFREHDEGAEMYYIQAGCVEVLVHGGKRVAGQLKAGRYFGEGALFETCRRTASVRTCTETELVVLAKADLDAVIATGAFHDVAARLAEAATERKRAVAARRDAAARKRLADERRRVDEQRAAIEMMRMRLEPGGGTRRGSTATARTAGGAGMAAWRASITSLVQGAPKEGGQHLTGKRGSAAGA